MAEGTLYCESCGEDIHIVPDFEPELELNMEETINNIVEELHEDMMEEPEEWAEPGEWEEPEDEEEYRETQRRARRRKRRLRVLLVFGILLILAAGATSWYAYAYNSEEYQLNRADMYVRQGRYDEAILCYNRAMELDGDNIDLLFDLAEVYLLKNNKVEYEYLLREIINSPNITSEQLEGAYGKLIGIYRDREDYQTINDLLLASENETLISQYQNYIVRVPEFSVNEGYYTSIQPLKLTATGAGKIYYTMDGSEPTENSTQYTAPIILENGDYTVKALFVNERGIASDIVSKEYHIENNEIPPPEISVLSGEYHFPMDIEVTSDDPDVYYTTDGSEPTYASTPYTGPIHMPLGRSNYNFARIVDGVTGTVVKRTYHLVLNTEYTPEQAVASVIDYSMRTGKIYDEQGHFDDSGDSYIYEYLYVTNINKVNDFYVIVEVYRTADGTITRTGNNFAVNIYSGERFKLQRDERGRLTLIEIEQEIINEDINEDSWEEE